MIKELLKPFALILNQYKDYKNKQFILKNLNEKGNIYNTSLLLKFIKNLIKRRDKMAKLTAWIVTIIGVLLLIEQLEVLAQLTQYNGWLISIAVLAIGISKLIRNYKFK